MKLKYAYIPLAMMALILISIAGYLLKPVPIQLKPSSFQQLPGWNGAHVKQSFAAFQRSCNTFMHQAPEQTVGSDQIQLQVKDWLPACRASKTLYPITNASTKDFFEKWFQPIEFRQKTTLKGLFTGYYLPQLQGSLTKTAEYSVPIYGLPDNLISVNLRQFGNDFSRHQLIGRLENNKLTPFYTRADINKGAIDKHSPVLAWVNSPIDRLFLGIQGSGMVKLTNGDTLYLGYAGENGAPYTAIAKVLIDKGVMTLSNASMQGIKKYLEAHPDEMDDVLNQNKSFVFFQLLKNSAAMGAQGVVLTPGYSLAVDRKWIPLGAPLWLATTHPTNKSNSHEAVLQRLMIAQDTGGAIRGAVRGDVFWGAGKKATFIAGNMKNKGNYWLLLPREAVNTLFTQK